MIEHPNKDKRLAVRKQLSEAHQAQYDVAMAEHEMSIDALLERYLASGDCAGVEYKVLMPHTMAEQIKSKYAAEGWDVVVRNLGASISFL